MSLKYKIGIIICVYFAGYATALKLKPEPAKLSQDSEAKIVAKKVTKKKYDPNTGKLAEEETSEDIDSFLKSRMTAVVPPPAPPVLQDNVMGILDTKLRFSALVKLDELPLIKSLPFIPPHTWVGYEKDLRTGEDIYKLGYSRRVF